MQHRDALESWVIADRDEDEQQVMLDALLAYFEHQAGERPFDDDAAFGKSTYDYILARDVIWWGRHYLPHHISAIPAKFHKEMSRRLHQRVYDAMAAPRSHAKSTIVTVAHTLHQAALKRARFIVIIGATQPLAVDHLDAIISELVENEALISDYPHLAPPDPAELRRDRKKQKRQRQTDFVTAGGVRFSARGAGQSLRGMKEVSTRPDLIILDDVDDDETVRSVKMIDKLYRWFDQVVMALEGDVEMRIRAVGTIIHKKALIARLLGRWNGPTWKAIIDFDAEEVQWPEVWPFARLIAKRDGGVDVDGSPMRGIGRDAFANEYQNEPFDERRVQLDPEWIILVDDLAQVPDFPHGGSIAIGVDLALSEREESSYNALVYSFRHFASDRIYMLYAERWRAPIGVTRSRIIAAARGEPVQGPPLPPATRVAIESVQFQSTVVQDVIPKIPCIVVGVVPDRDKRTRFQVLAAQYSLRRVVHGPHLPRWFREDLIEPSQNDTKDASVYSYLGHYADGGQTTVSTAVLIQDSQLASWQ